VDPDLVKLIANYVVGLVLVGLAGYMMITTGEVPEYWMELVIAFIGAIYLVQGIARTVQRRKR